MPGRSPCPSFVVVLVVAAALVACEALEPTGRPAADDTLLDGDAAASDGDVSLADAGSSAVQWPTTWTVVVPDGAPDPLQGAGDELVETLGMMGLAVTRVGKDEGEVLCEPGVGTVVLAGYQVGRVRFDTGDALTSESWRIEPETCDDPRAPVDQPPGVLVLLAGRSLLGRQYAVWAWLHELGVRFFHPEQRFVPTAPDWPQRWAVEQVTPRMPLRGLHLASDVPHELVGPEATAAERRRVVDWIVRNHGNLVLHRGGAPDEYAAGLGLRALVTRDLFGANGLFDVSAGPTTEAVAAALVPLVDGLDEPVLLLTLDADALASLDDPALVAWLATIADVTVAELPGVEVIVALPAPTPAGWPGARLHGLLDEVPTNLGVGLRPHRGHDLLRPVPSLDGATQASLYDAALAWHQQRPLLLLPGTWATPGLPHEVPLVHPLAMDARGRDLELLDFMVDDRLRGQVVTTGGLEWSGWMAPRCALRASALPDAFFRECVDDVVAPFGDAAPTVRAVLLDVTTILERDLLHAGIAPWLHAPRADVALPPLPAPETIRSWTLQEVEAWRGRVEPALLRLGHDLDAALAELALAGADVPAAAQPWLAELFDALQMIALRAHHTRESYDALVTFREATLAFDDTLVDTALAAAAAASERTVAAGLVVQARSPAYRYAPLSRAIASGPNPTGHPYRYLTSVHEQRPFVARDEAVAAVLAGRFQGVTVDDVVIGPGESLRVASAGGDAIEVDFGDGSPVASGPEHVHDCVAPGVYELRVVHTVVPEDGSDADGEDVTSVGRWACLESEHGSGFDGVVLVPAEASAVEFALPAVVLGPVDAERAVLGFVADEGRQVQLGDLVVLPRVAEGDGVTTAPTRISLPGANHEDEAFFASLRVDDVVVELAPDGSLVTFTGQLGSDSAVETVAAAAGFELEGARELLASVLGYTTETLPERLDFEVEYPLTMEAP